MSWEIIILLAIAHKQCQKVTILKTIFFFAVISRANILGMNTPNHTNYVQVVSLPNFF